MTTPGGDATARPGIPKRAPFKMPTRDYVERSTVDFTVILLGGIMFLGFTVFFVYYVLTTPGPTPTNIVIGGWISMALGFGTSALGLHGLARRLRRPSETGGIDTTLQGTRFTYFRYEFPAALVVIGAPAIAATAISVIVAFSSRPAWVFASAIPALYWWLFLIAAMRRNIRPGSLTLTPTSLIHQGWSFTTVMPWDDVSYVHPLGDQILIIESLTTYRSSSEIRHRVWRVDSPWAGGIWLDTTAFATSHKTIHRLVSHYATHPEHRNELTTASAVQRAAAP